MVPLKIACDLEGVLANSNHLFARVLSERYKMKVPESFQYQWNLLETAKHALGIELTPALHEDVWEEVWRRWREIPVIGEKGINGGEFNNFIGKVEGLLGHEVTILTHSFNARIEAWKAKWIEAHFPGARVVWVNGAMAKHDFEFDVFIDDGPHNVVSLYRLGKNVIVYTQPWNLGLSEEWYSARVFTLVGILGLLQKPETLAWFTRKKRVRAR